MTCHCEDLDRNNDHRKDVVSKLSVLAGSAIYKDLDAQGNDAKKRRHKGCSPGAIRIKEQE